MSIEDPTDALGEELESLSTTAAATSSFAAALDIILSWQKMRYIDRDINKTLRLTCKAVKCIVDTHAKSLEETMGWMDPVNGALNEISPWPWPNLIDLRIELLRMKTRLEDDTDVSSALNGVFDSCFFPKLTELYFGNDEYYDDDDIRPTWNRPPSASVRQLINSFSELKILFLNGLNISREVADYLGNLRGQTHSRLEIRQFECHISETVLSPERQQLLDKLDIDVGQWNDFCRYRVSEQLYTDCMHWNIMSDFQLKRVTYGAALVECTQFASTAKLESVLAFLEAEEEGSVMTVDALDSLKQLLQRLYMLHDNFLIRQQLTCENIHSLMDYFQDELV